MKKILLLAAVALMAVTAGAIPAKPGVRKLVTKDGSTIEATLVGDEFHHSFVSTDGYIVKATEDNYYVKTDEKFDVEKASAIRQQAKASREAQMEPKSVDITETNYANKGLVILVSFADKTFTKTNQQFTNMLNQSGYSYNRATGSAKDYFNATSYGKYNPTFDVYGPYTLPNNMRYYGQNQGYYYGSDANAAQMVVDAVALLVADQGQNVLKQYDCDNNGYVDNVFIFYAGYAESSTGTDDEVWPHRSWVMEGYVSGQLTYGGKTIYDYACSSELDGTSGSTMTAIGAFTHEFSHVLGLPDLYDTNGTDQWATPNTWDIMDAGCYNNHEKTPPAYSAQERFYVGWLTPTVLKNGGTYTLANLNDGEGQAYMITSTGTSNLDPTNPSPKDYYLLENRQQSGWDKYLSGHGMLVWKVSYDSRTWEENTVNNRRSSLGCVVVTAGGDQYDSYYGYYAADSDPFPGTDKVTAFTPYTKFALRQITESGGQISFVLGDATDVDNVSADDAPVILRERVTGGRVRIENLKEGMNVIVVDAMGRVLMRMAAESDVMEFDAPDAVYFIRFE